MILIKVRDTFLIFSFKCGLRGMGEVNSVITDVTTEMNYSYNYMPVTKYK